jgi:hypothetical protein
MYGLQAGHLQIKLPLLSLGVGVKARSGEKRPIEWRVATSASISDHAGELVGGALHPAEADHDRLIHEDSLSDFPSLRRCFGRRSHTC